VNDDSRWLRIKQLFRDSQQIAESGRESWLAEQCAGDEDLLREVHGLLAAQQSTHGILDGGAADVLRRMGSAEVAGNLVGKRIGNYRLLRLVGEGGMGSVYLAEREGGDFVQRVALKLVRADFVSEEMRSRFLRERNFLARLVHPHIAQLHDGGVAADGTPYFTLEYIEGEPITRYCDAHALDIRQRVALMLQVCSAVAYAHRNLIVHRDLKPSNIFVTADGEAKLLDFGIAKLVDPEVTEGQTATQARMMTPEYAAPEQVLGEPITTATDVYAIGVLLYELLCGRLPYARADAGTISWAKAVVEEAPESLGRALSRDTGNTDKPTGETAAATRSTTLPTLRRSLRGDLDRIVQRALAKEPDQRYPSVGALADDLRAYVDGRALSGGSRRYRMRKFVRRYWLPLTAAATVALVLIGSGVVIVWQARQTEHQAQTTLAVRDFLYGLFTAVNPHEAKGREVSARELLDRGAERIDRNTTLDAAQKGEVEGMLGRIYYSLGLFDRANNLQEGAISSLSAIRAPSLQIARIEIERADTLVDLPQIEVAAAVADDARRRIDAATNADVDDRLKVAHVQARVAINQGEVAKGKRIADEELILARETVGVDPLRLFRALMSSGYASWASSRFDEAESHYREALALSSHATGLDELDVADAQFTLAGILKLQSRYAESRQLQEQAVATNEKVLGAESKWTLRRRRDLAVSNFFLGDYAQARAILEQGIAIIKKSNPAENDLTVAMGGSLGTILVESGDPDEAERVLTNVLANASNAPTNRILIRLASSDLAAAHIEQGKLEQAQAELTQLLDREVKDGIHESGDVTDRCRLGDVKRLLGDTQAAIGIQSAALAASRKAYGESNPHTASAHEYLALSLRDSGDVDAAEREFRAALAAYAGYIPHAEHPLAATTRYELALLLVKHDATRAEGISLLAEAASLREKFLGKDEPSAKQARAALAQAQKLAKL
jgi:serine/threonine-protein kinase